MIKKIRCPCCRKFAEWNENPYRPFCSDLCKNRDLGNWAMEKYRIEQGPNNDEDRSEGKSAESREE